MSWEFPPDVSTHDIERYTAVLEAAARSHPTPNCSGFKVRGAAMTTDGTIVWGANHEYGIGEGMHSEETTVSMALEMAPGRLVQTMAFTWESAPEGEYTHSCGNCRDYTIPHATKDLVYVQAAMDGGPVDLMPLQGILYEPRRIATRFSLKELEAILVASKERPKAYVGHLPEHLHDDVFGAAAITEDGSIFGAHYFGGGCYHGTSALWNALVKAKDNAPVAKVVVAGPKMPHVPYKDRQRLAEFVENDNGGRTVHVLLARTRRDKPVKGLRTESGEWIPKTFVFKI